VASFITSTAKTTQQGTHEVTSYVVGVTKAAGDSSIAAKELLKSATDLTRQSEVLSKQVQDFLGMVRVA
jgi:methyl-accepting chemotaxis protein